MFTLESLKVQITLEWQRIKRHLVENDIAQALDQSRKTEGKKDRQSKVLCHGVAFAEVLARVVAGDCGRVVPTKLEQLFPI